jgi:hypothetical protein
MALPHAPTRFQPGPRRKTAKDQLIERFEQKYVVPPRDVPRIREFIRPFCIADPSGSGEIPEYTVTTLQLDTVSSDLVLAKEREAFDRFKLRIRTYGTDANPSNPVFLEIKRKSGGVIIKSRAKMKRGDYRPGMILDPSQLPRLGTEKDNANLMEFCRLCGEIGARPRILIRYIRESYFGENDDYARVTIDRRLTYRPTDSWELPADEPGSRQRWRTMDTQTGLRCDFAGYIFELKAMRDVPTWMLEMIERFNLIPIGFSKYATAHRLEGLSCGRSYTASGENVTL